MATNLMTKSKKQQNKHKRSKKHTVLDLLEYKKITDDDKHFILLKDGTYCDFLQVPGIGLDSFPNKEFSEITDGFTAFLKQYIYDLTFMTTKFPASTQEQQIYWNQKLYKLQTKKMQTNDPDVKKKLDIKERYISQSLQVIRNVERYLENQEYVCIVFAKTTRELISRCQDVKHYGGQYLNFYEMDLNRKEKLLFKFNNMNTPLNG